MNEEDMKINAERNKTRLQLRVGADLFNQTTKEQLEKFKEYRILSSRNNEVPIDRLDFNKSMIFICVDYDFSCLIPYYGLLRINNVVIPDYSYDGANSFIKTNFMVVNSRDVRFSQIPQDSFYDYGRDGDIPDSWNSIMYNKKELCIWRLASSVGMGDNEKMYNTCYAWIEDRKRNGKMDWIFYTGPEEQFKTEYKDLAKLDIPVYIINKRK